MENNGQNTGNAFWSNAARDGLMLSLITVVISTLNILLNISFLSTIFWLIKTVGSIWLLWFFMRRYMLEDNSGNPFSYGVATCTFSSVVCAVWSFVLSRFLFPDKVTEALDQVASKFGELPSEYAGTYNQVMDVFSDIDTYARVGSLATLLWAFLIGVIASAIINASLNRNRDIFADCPEGDGNESNEDDDDII